MLSRPGFCTFPCRSRRESMRPARGLHAFAGSGPDEVSGPARESMAHCLKAARTPLISEHCCHLSVNLMHEAGRCDQPCASSVPTSAQCTPRPHFRPLTFTTPSAALRRKPFAACATRGVIVCPISSGAKGRRLCSFTARWIPAALDHGVVAALVSFPLHRLRPARRNDGARLGRINHPDLVEDFGRCLTISRFHAATSSARPSARPSP